jgi:hypothetical protein
MENFLHTNNTLHPTIDPIYLEIEGKNADTLQKFS